MRYPKEYQILIIEDNQADVALIKIYLEEFSLPCRLLEATTLEAGIQMVYDHDVDLVLLDLTLPDSGRFQTLKRFLQKVPNVPIVVMTGYKDEMMGIQSVRAGAQDFLVKGEFEGKELSKSVRYALQRFSRQNQLQETAKALSSDQEHYRVVHQMAKLGNWDLDLVTYSMKWNDEMFRILGISPRGFPPTLSDYLNLVHTEDRPQVETFFETALNNEEVHRIKHRVLINNRNLKYIALQARLNYDEAQQKILLIGSIQDITEHRTGGNSPTPENTHVENIQLNMLRQISEAQLRHLQAIANNIAVKGDIDQPDPTMKRQPQLAQHFNGLLHATCQLYNLPQLFSGGFLPLNDKECSLKKLFHQLQQLLDLIRYQGNRISLQLDAGLPDHVISDAGRIQHLFITLFCLGQAPDSQLSSVEIYVGSREISKNVATIHALISCRGAVSHLEKVEAFIESDNVLEFFLEDQKREWPLALAIAGKLTKTLNGISHFREKGPGSCQVEMEFPVQIISPPPSATRSLDKPIRILLVEDHAINQIATRRMLTAFSDQISVDIASDGETGLQMFKERNYEVVLMDLHLPAMDGITAARHIRSLGNTPIIALTPDASAEEERQCLAAGMNDYMAKPFQIQDIYPKILKLIWENERYEQ